MRSRDETFFRRSLASVPHQALELRGGTSAGRCEIATELPYGKAPLIVVLQPPAVGHRIEERRRIPTKERCRRCNAKEIEHFLLPEKREEAEYSRNMDV